MKGSVPMTTTNSLQYKDIKKCYKARSKREKIVSQSSSGGVFYEVAKNILSEGGAVFGVAFQENGTVQFEKAETETEAVDLMGSKYIQAKANQVYSSVKKHLLEGHKVLFCGTPCQCNALKSFLNKKEYQNLFTVDFICHGVPSEGVWEKYLEWIAQGRKVSSISFRDKTISWGDYGTRILFENGTEYFQKHQDDSYMKLFLANRILRPSCHRCSAKGNKRCSDLTLGDYWGIKDEDAKLGCSVVMVNTEKGATLLNKADKRIELAEIAYDDAVRNNSNYFQSCGIPFNRSKVFAAIVECPEKVFAEPQKYTETSFTEKVIRKCIRIWRRLTKTETKETYLKFNEIQKTVFEARAKCCGCGACENACPVHAITMKLDEEGFRYPVFDNRVCIHCGVCEQVCLNRFM